MKIDEVEVLGVDIVFDGKIDYGVVNWGSITLQNDGREFILDPYQSNILFEDGQTTISSDLHKDEETFPDCKWDLTKTDLHGKLDVAVMYVDEFDEEPESITLFVKFISKDGTGMTKAIDLDLEV